MLPSYEQRARLSKMATPYKNGTTFPPENEEVGTGPGGGNTQSRVQILLSPEHAEMAYLYDRKKTFCVECSYFVGQVTCMIGEWRADWPEFLVGLTQREGSGAVADSKWGTQGHVLQQLRPVLVLFQSLSGNGKESLVNGPGCKHTLWNVNSFVTNRAFC